jgi:hypothetical protein
MTGKMRLRGFIFSSLIFSLWLLQLTLLSWQSEAMGNSPKPPTRGVMGGLLPGWRIAGDVDVGFTWQGKGPSSSGHAMIRVELRDVEVRDPTETFAAEGIQGVIRLKGPPAPGDAMPIEAEISIKRGAFLLDRWFLELDGPPLFLMMKGLWDSRDRTLRDLKGVLGWAGLLRVAFTGQLRDPGRNTSGEMELMVSVPSHEALLSQLGKVLGEGSPFEGLSLGGGSTVSARLTMHGREGSELKGRFKVEGGSLGISNMDLRIRSIRGEIPFHIPLGRAAETLADNKGERPLKGSLKMDGISVGEALRIPTLHIPIRASRNSISINGPINIRLSGGTVVLERLEASRLIPLPPTLSANLRMEGIELVELMGGRVPWVSEGAISASLPDILLREGDLSTTGWISIRTWDGEIRIEDIWASDVFSKTRRWGCNVLMEDIDLERATSRMTMGRMGGRLDGYIKGLRFSFGQPEGFELWLRSDPSWKTKRFIDAKAVESISIISGGVKAPLLPFFKFYPYSRLGIYCKLENDVFYLRGTIREGGKEYLIKRGFFRGINVVNRNPNNRITWRDMIQRIRRIFEQEGKKARVEMGR